MIHPANFTPFTFPDSTFPKGFLSPRMECQALYYYAVLQKKAEEDAEETIILEDVGITKPAPRQLFISIANLYNVNPEIMVNFWPHVDKQFEREGLPLLTANARFDKPIVISTDKELN